MLASLEGQSEINKFYHLLHNQLSSTIFGKRILSVYKNIYKLVFEDERKMVVSPTKGNTFANVEGNL